MKIVLYHEIDPSHKDTVFAEGIEREAEGEKTDSENDIADAYLDEHMPPEVAAWGVSRQEVVYAYMEYQGAIIDIRDGEFIPVDEFNDRSEQALLRLSVDSKDCYVSDLDAYDALLTAIETDKNDPSNKYLAAHYWDHVLPYDKYVIGEYDRPEILIAADIAPESISEVE